MQRSDEVEEAAMAYAMAKEQERGWAGRGRQRARNAGYDLVSQVPAASCATSRSRAGRAWATVELSQNEWLKAQQLGDDYWLYVVTDAVVYARAAPGAGPQPPPGAGRSHPAGAVPGGAAGVGRAAEEGEMSTHYARRRRLTKKRNSQASTLRPTGWVTTRRAGRADEPPSCVTWTYVPFRRQLSPDVTRSQARSIIVTESHTRPK